MSHSITFVYSIPSNQLDSYIYKSANIKSLFFFFLKLLNSSAAGDWVNCGICGEWAHFGCDRRQGLGAFKVWFLFIE